jgi:hypothetical protein
MFNCLFFLVATLSENGSDGVAPITIRQVPKKSGKNHHKIPVLCLALPPINRNAIDNKA